MHDHSPTHSTSSANSFSIVTVTRRVVRERAVILAVIVGRPAQAVSKSDWDQAKQELLGRPAPVTRQKAPRALVIELT